MLLTSLEPLKAAGHLRRLRSSENLAMEIHTIIPIPVFPALLAMVILGSADISKFSPAQGSIPPILFAVSTMG